MAASGEAKTAQGGMPCVSWVAQAPVTDVWDVLADGWLYPVWVVGAARIRDVDASWPGHGSRLHHSFGLWPALVDDTTDVLEVDAGSYLQLRTRAWPFGEAEVQIHLSSEGPAQTRMRLCEKAVRGPGRLIPAVVQAPLVDWRNREALRRLAMLAEGRAARPASQRPATTPHASNTRSSS